MIPKIESFEETNAKFSIIPNSIFDILASSDLNPYETKILVIIARNTYGWRADFDEISVSQFMGTDEQGKSTMSKPTVLKSLKSLEEKGLILSCLFVVNNVQKKLYFINTDDSAKMVNLIKSGAIKYSELKSYRLHKIANQKSTFNLANYTERVVNHVDGGSQSPLPGGSTTLTGVVNLVDGGSQSHLPTKNNLNYSLNNNLKNNLNLNTPHTPQGGQVCESDHPLPAYMPSEKFREASAQVMDDYAPAFKALANNPQPQTTEQNPPSPSSAAPPSRRASRKPSEIPQYDPEGFAEFYAQYPKKKSKVDAVSAWDKLKPNEELKGIIMHDVSRRKQSDPDWIKDNGRYVVYPSTYLNKRLWTDEVEVLIDAAPIGQPKHQAARLSQHEINMIELKKYAEKHGVNF